MKMSLSMLMYLAAALLSENSYATDVSIARVRNFGNGCPANSIQVVLSPEGTTLSILYSQFQADVGGPAPASTLRDCEIDIELNKALHSIPQISSADFRGFIQLDPGVGAQEWSEIDMDGGQYLHVFARHLFNGPLSQNYLLKGQVPWRSKQVLQCGNEATTQLRIRAHFQLAGGTSQKLGLMSVDSLDGVLMHTYHLGWRNCAPKNPWGHK